MKLKLSGITGGIRFKMTLVMVGMLLLLLGMGMLAYVRIGSITHNTRYLMQDNALRTGLIQRELEHLLWSIKIDEFLHQDKASLDIELDYRQCGFGRWYYSEQRHQTEARIPAIRDLLIAIEQPHRELHQSAIDILRLKQKTDASALKDASHKQHDEVTHNHHNAFDIYQQKTIPLLIEVRNLLNQIVSTSEQFSTQQTQTLQSLLQYAHQTQWLILIVNLLGLLITGVGMLFVIRGLMHQLGGEPVEIQRIAGQVAQGQLDIVFQTERQHTGIYASIRSMVESLRTMNCEREQQNWIKTGQTQLSAQMGGDLSIVTLAENVINFLTPYLNAQVGAFYVLEKGGTEQDSCLRMLASHAYVWNNTLPTRYALGEDIVGQAGLERKVIVVEETPQNHIRIESGLGESLPHAILVAPFLFEDELKGVVEIATLHQFTPTHLALLEQILPIIAITVNTTESRAQLNMLLTQSQAQTNELAQQTQTLQLQRMEMQHANEELQSQSEQLQSQQEELRQTNEELEERTRDLERQQTEIKQKNVALQKTKQEMETKAQELALASKYKSEFLANMSHELRTPLNSLLILAQLLADDKEGNLSDKQKECARTIYTSGSDLLALINEVLDLSKVEAGKLELYLAPVATVALIDSIEKKFQHVAAEKGLTLAIQVADDFPTEIKVDLQRVQQVISNLLSNALKFTAEGSVRLALQRATADSDLSRSGLDYRNVLAFHVSDTGIGIPQDKQILIFEAFQQADGTTNRKYGGTGLGLSISRQLVQTMGGEIQLTSEEGKGSTFSFYLPALLEAQVVATEADILNQSTVTSAETCVATPVTTTTNAEPPSLTHTTTATIVEEALPSAPVMMRATLPDDRETISVDDKVLLIVEDDEKFAKILFDLAHEKNYQCIHAADGHNAIHCAEHYKPNAIMLDVGLPLVDGWTVMARLKDNPETRHIPIHVMSGYEQSANAKRLGAIGYSLKPVSMNEMSDAFHRIEHVINASVRKPLLLVDDPTRSQALQTLLSGEGVNTTLVASIEEAETDLQRNNYDCLVVDMDLKQGKGIEFLQRWYANERAEHIPLILYAERDLTAEETAVLQHCEEKITIKTVKTPERLLDEATLFLHQVESALPEEKRKMLQMAHDKDHIFQGRKILLVDDDVRNTFALAAALEEKDMDVVIGKNGKQGLQLLEQTPDIDLVLMDIMMPEMDGYETMQQIRKQVKYKRLPIIALTAKAMKNDKARCIDAGASDYLAKPVDMDKLLSLMRVWLYR